MMTMKISQGSHKEYASTVQQYSKTRWLHVLCRMSTTQYSAQRARLAVHKLFTSCIRRGLLSRDSIADGYPSMITVNMNQINTKTKQQMSAIFLLLCT